MKPLSFLLALTILSSTLIAQSPPLPAEKVMELTIERATKENKNILLIFHASWCGWCHKMDSSLNDPSIKANFDKYYVIEHLTVQESKTKLALENPGGMDIMKKYHGETSGLPFWVILDKKGELIADSRMKDEKGELQNTGCPANQKEVEYWISLLKKTSKIPDSQLDLIAKRFRLNESH